jgi:uncharacterized protein (DUF1501 family)
MAHECEEFERVAGMQRRTFLRAAVAGGALSTTMFGTAVRQASFAASTGGNTLVVLSLRGGADGLGLVVPHGDPGYYAARSGTAVPRRTLVAQDAFFGLHPALAPLVPYWKSRELAAVHAVGMQMPNRSHFEAMEKIEDADPGSELRSGWVNRMVGLGGTASPFEAVHLSSVNTPTLLVGREPVLASKGLEKLRVAGTATTGLARYQQLTTAWSQSSDELGAAARSAIQVSKTFTAGTLNRPYVPANGAVYPTAPPARDLADALKDTAKLIRGKVGTEVVSIDFGPWDMHGEYGTVDGGDMLRMTSALARSLAAFLKDLGDLRSRVTVVTISEFGRRVEQNGNNGLDHGWGNAMLVVGGGVRGGRYHGRWPWLSAGKLVDGDLKVTTDYRDVLAEVIAKRFPDRTIAGVFPGLVHQPLGVMR